jgi:hypothetical protein
MNAFLVQSFGGFHLNGDDSFGIARASAIHTGCIFGGWDERRDCIHMGREKNRRSRLLGGHSEHIAARAFGGNLLRVEASPEQLSVQEIAHRAFVSGDGLDVHKLTRKGDGIHARQDT